ncbi:uncharacterized protein [Medicago truncatula]|uniref:uncharacterized protein n=1 Tax=Medicago truncatula TaxID=3880 RepID=UPI00196870D2|nr:uncharacterized protein LOC120576086 [Medicago truncatula]
MVEANVFTGYSVGGANSVVVSHLQFADDTLLIGNKSWANVRALRAGLVLFEAMSGLKVNFHKSSLVGVNINASWLSEAASVLGCKVGKIPFLYLGLPIRGNPRRLLFWEPIVNCIKSRLSGWHSRYLSFGGRLILLKSVLTALPVYALSFFKAPSETDRWIWLPDQISGYTVRGVYDLLTSQEQPHVHQNMELIWHNQVPLKVSILAWRLLRDRLPTKSNLVERGIISVENRFCVTGCGQVEDVNHLFLSCPIFGALWPLVRAWLGVEGVDSHTISDHCVQFIEYAGL